MNMKNRINEAIEKNKEAIIACVVPQIVRTAQFGAVQFRGFCCYIFRFHCKQATDLDIVKIT